MQPMHDMGKRGDFQRNPTAPASSATTPTALVQRAAEGDVDAMRSLFSSVYPDFKRLAARSQRSLRCARWLLPVTRIHILCIESWNT